MQLNAKHSPLNCYLIPGLGATVEIFDKLELPPFVQRTPIKWISPKPRESLSDYAERLLPQIDRSEPFILAGCSFGGVIALELARHCKPELTVLVSSIPASRYLPKIYQLVKWTGVHLLTAQFCRFPKSTLRKPLGWAFGVTDREAIDMLSKQLADSDPLFMRWAVPALLNWEHEQSNGAVLHFHGDGDRILPLGTMEPDVKIPGGGHLIVYTHGAEIGAALSAHLHNRLTGARATKVDVF